MGLDGHVATSVVLPLLSKKQANFSFYSGILTKFKSHAMSDYRRSTKSSIMTFPILSVWYATNMGSWRDALLLERRVGFDNQK